MGWQYALAILGIFVPLFHLMGLLFAAHAILMARTSQGAVAWAMSLAFVPYVAVPLYLVFGRRRFHGYVEARRQGDGKIDHLADRLAAAMHPARATLRDACQRFAVLETLSLLPFSTGNQARLLIDGKDTFDAIFHAIDNAKTYLLVQFFIVRDDALGRDLQQRLIARAKAGVAVYFIYDEIGSLGLPWNYVAELRAAGVRIQPFNTRRGWRNRFQLNFRNHRKIVVADGTCAYVGGHNVGVEYLGQSKRFGHWRDTHVEIKGPAVAELQWTFLEDWHWATGEILELTSLHAAPPAGGSPLNAPAGNADAIVIATGPADHIPACTFMFLALISAARKRFWITSPYFVPDEPVYEALQLAALRGVDVRIMLPDKPDHILVYLSAFSYLDSAEAVGVKFYRYQSGFLHQKVMLIDDDLAAVGTANLDNRSVRLNFELTAIVADQPFAAAVEKMLLADFENSRRATRGDLKRRGLAFRLAVRIARLLSPIQ